jgi:hypothetical protein
VTEDRRQPVGQRHAGALELLEARGQIAQVGVVIDVAELIAVLADPQRHALAPEPVERHLEVLLERGPLRRVVARPG